MQNLNQAHVLFQQSAVLFQQFLQFEPKILQLAQQMALDLSQYEIDHLALRTNNLATTQQWQASLSCCARLLSQNNVNGRKICLFELRSPLYFAKQKVSIIELPYPNEKVYAQQGWEHIEVVIPFLPQESSQDWLLRLQQQFLWNKSPHLMVKISEPKVAKELLPNPSIAVRLACQSDNHCCIKIHPYSIKQIVKETL